MTQNAPHNPINYQPLNGLRGMALLFVLFSHAANRGYTLLDDIAIAGAGSGKVGVYLFFVLSAFLLTDQMLKRYSLDNLFALSHLKKYANRRFFRIYPLFLFVLLTLWLGNIYWDDATPFQRFADLNLIGIIQHLLLIQGEAHLWTIAAEFKFYILLPVLCYGLIYCQGHFVRTSGYIAGLGLICFALYMITNINFLLYLPIFICGIYAAYLFNKYPAGIIQLSDKQANMIAGLFIVLIILTMPKTIMYLTDWKIRLSNPVACGFYGALWACFLLFALWYKSALQTCLQTRTLSLIGLISYSAYLWHWLILDLLDMTTIDHGAVKALIFYPLTLFIAYVSYRLIEEPCLNNKLWRNKAKPEENKV